jgi:catechol 2,3-dioxygenase-like lactoylglutathione lyase family enzyme
MNDRPIHHVCYIVDDIPKAVGQWVEVTGAGPFFHLGEHVEFDEMLLEGEPCVFDHASAIGKWGPIFLELIELHDVTPELASRFYTGVAGGSNIAHIAYIVDDPAAESERLDVLPRDVVDAADRCSAAERAVGSALVVVAEPV